MPSTLRTAQAVSSELAERRAFSERCGDDDLLPFPRVVTGIGPLRVEQREVAGQDRRLAAVLMEGRRAAHLQAEEEDVVLRVGDRPRGDGGEVEPGAVEFHDAEIAQRRVVHRHVEPRRRLHAAFVIDEDLAGNVVPEREAVARMNVGQRQDGVHRRLARVRPQVSGSTRTPPLRRAKSNKSVRAQPGVERESSPQRHIAMTL